MTSRTGSDRGAGVLLFVGAPFRARRSPVARGRVLPQLFQPGGFTLVEITIVIFIMATMMAVAVPYFLHYYNEAKLDGAAREFATATQLARLQAVTQQREARLQFDLDRQTYAIFVGATESGSELVESFAVPLKVRLASAQVGDEPVRDSGEVVARFYPNGTSEGLTVVFRGQDRRGGTAVWVDPVTSRGTTLGVK